MPLSVQSLLPRPGEDLVWQPYPPAGALARVWGLTIQGTNTSATGQRLWLSYLVSDELVWRVMLVEVQAGATAHLHCILSGRGETRLDASPGLVAGVIRCPRIPWVAQSPRVRIRVTPAAPAQWTWESATALWDDMYWPTLPARQAESAASRPPRPRRPLGRVPGTEADE